MNNLAQLHIDRTNAAARPMCTGLSRLPFSGSFSSCRSSSSNDSDGTAAGTGTVWRSVWRHRIREGPKKTSACTTDRNGGSVLDALVASRRSHRRYQARNVEKTIRHLIGLLQNAPNVKQAAGRICTGRRCRTDGPARTFASERMDALAACGIYPDGYDAKAFRIKRAEETTTGYVFWPPP
ncbi:MAG: hypothetical protein ACLVJ6_08045 [Merdibacter sp.]